ncbi:hypothetical protein PQR71_29215 [Paraburkholderia fungorum]|uniref:hypothetical protein n=1 Tax=Paraburkholderia fungorum TaxID=134537 RepID=UPI0038BCFA1E
MNRVKEGGIVRSLVNQCDVIVGGLYAVANGADEDGIISVWDAVGERFCLTRVEYEPANVGPYIINGAPKEYPTLEAAEAGVKAFGNNGVTYEIAQIVKRVTVKRETVVTLEEAV